MESFGTTPPVLVADFRVVICSVLLAKSARQAYVAIATSFRTVFAVVVLPAERSVLLHHDDPVLPPGVSTYRVKRSSVLSESTRPFREYRGRHRFDATRINNSMRT